MKQKSLLKTLLLLCALVVGSVSAWAEDTTWSHTFASPETISNNSITVGDATWNVSTTDGQGSPTISTGTYSQTYGLKFGSSKSNYFGSVTFSTDYFKNYNVKSVTVNILNNGSKEGTLTAQQGTTTIGSTSATFGQTWTDLTVNTQTGTGGTLSFTYSVQQAFCIHSITVVYTSDPVTPTVATPTFNPEAGTFNTAQNVTLSCTTQGADIYYTTNGDVPTAESTKYTEAISVTTATTIKAIAVKSGMNNSAVATAEYTIKPSKPTISVEGNTITITGDQGCTFYYTTDGSAPTNASTQYNAPFELHQTCTIKAIAYDAYGNASETDSKAYEYIPIPNPKNINSGYFVKVTDASKLEDGDAILIVYEGALMAMSTTQNTNNRAAVDVTINEGVINDPSNNVQKLVLLKDNGYFCFYTGEDGYLRAASSSSNWLRTGGFDENSKATIVFSDGSDGSDGDATITFQGANTRNILRYNSNNGSPVFSCYGESSTVQTPVQIYKEVDPALTAVVSTAGWATWNAPCAVSFPEGVNAYLVTVNSDPTKVSLIEVSDVPANTPVLLEASAGTYTMTSVESSTTSTADNLLRVSTGTNSGTMYVLAKIDEVVGFYMWDPSKTLPEGKIYLEMPGSVRPFIALPGEETGISDMNRETITNNRYFDLQGRRVAQPTKGMYIVNGKKVVVK